MPRQALRVPARRVQEEKPPAARLPPFGAGCPRRASCPQPDRGPAAPREVASTVVLEESSNDGASRQPAPSQASQPTTQHRSGSVTRGLKRKRDDGEEDACEDAAGDSGGDRSAPSAWRSWPPGAPSPAEAPPATGAGSQALDSGGLQMYAGDEAWTEQGACWHEAVLRPGLLQSEAETRLSFGEGDMRSAASQPAVEADVRTDTVDWMMSTHQASDLALPAIFLAVQLLDRCLALSQVEPERQLLLGAACLVLAAKFEEYNAPELSFVANAAGNQFTMAEVIEMELWVLRTLEYRLHLPTAVHHLGWFQRQDGQLSRSKYSAALAQYLCELPLAYVPGSGQWPPSLHAAAAVRLADALLRRRGRHKEALESISDDPAHRGAFEAIVAQTRRALERVHTGDAVFQKYGKKEHLFVSWSAQTLLKDLPETTAGDVQKPTLGAAGWLRLCHQLN